MRMSRARALAVGALAVASFGALCLLVVQVWRSQTGERRAGYVETTLRLDSLTARVEANDAYTHNLIAILEGEPSPVNSQPDTLQVRADAMPSTLIASEEEREFVRAFEADERFNLSVLSPIAADGMTFGAPTSPGGWADAIYRGTVVAVSWSAGLATVVVQHPNDFISVYKGLGALLTDRGAKIAAGQRIGRGDALSFELWHNGSQLDPDDYIALSN